MACDVPPAVRVTTGPSQRNRSGTVARSGTETVNDELLLRAIPGFGISPLTRFLGSEDLEANPKRTVAETRAQLLSFLKYRNSSAILARAGMRFLLDATRDPLASREYLPVEQIEVELLQALALSQPHGPDVPASPGNMVRMFGLALRNVKAFSQSIRPDGDDLTPVDAIVRQTRLQTLYYRNVFNSDEAALVVPALLSRMDAASNRRLDYSLADLSRACFAVVDLIGTQIDAYRRLVRPLLTGLDVESGLTALRRSSPMLERAWRYADVRFVSPEDRGFAAFQLSEMGWAQAFTLDRADLTERFGRKLTDAIFRCSLAFGELAGVDLDQIYLANPIHARPFIRLDEDTLFLPIPALLISFPFQVVEHLIGTDATLQEAYSRARASYLEAAVAEQVAEALPSASVYRKVTWTDPETGDGYENDVVVVLNNHVLLFEAKSGRLKPAARRGGVDSLRKNLKELYVGANDQAARLQRLLGLGKSASGLLRDAQGAVIPVDLSTPKIVSRFSICIEHLASITARRNSFMELGLVTGGEAWSPILSLAELRMIARYLDTEISFFHYLTRRFTIESILTFQGDEQDLLSMYLANGFCIDTEALRGQPIMFGWADAAVRGRKEARSDRTAAETPGIELSPGWKRIVEEVYRSGSRHRFDIIEVILNQAPPALAESERRIRKWRAGRGGFGRGNLIFKRAPIGGRVFVLAILAAKSSFASQEDWRDAARGAGHELLGTTDATDLVIFCRCRKSPHNTYDAMSFMRFDPRSVRETTGQIGP